MKKKERDRLKELVYEAYMAGQATGGKTEVILEALANKYGVCSRTLQNWIYDVRKERETRQRDYEETVKSIGDNLRHDLGLPPFPSTHMYMKDGHWVYEF